MKRLHVAFWSAAGWMFLLGWKNWWLTLAAWTVATLIEVSRHR